MPVSPSTLITHFVITGRQGEEARALLFIKHGVFVFCGPQRWPYFVAAVGNTEISCQRDMGDCGTTQKQRREKDVSKVTTVYFDRKDSEATTETHRLQNE